MQLRRVLGSGRVRTGSSRSSEPALDHAKDGFDLPALAVGYVVLKSEEFLHKTAISTPWVFGSTSSNEGRKEAADIVRIPGELVVSFAVKANVSKLEHQVPALCQW